MNRFWGGLLIAAGVVIALLSGLCTLAFAPSMLAGGPRAVASSVLVVAVAGGAPFLVGVGLAILGFRLGWPGKSPNTPATRAARRIAAVVMIALGALIAFISLLGLASALTRPNPIGLVMGLIGAAIGAGLVFGGTAIWRDPASRPSPDVF
jgi:hypothetical protein